MPTFYIDGRKFEQEDRFGNGSRWFRMMKLPDEADVVGPFTPVEFAMKMGWGLDDPKSVKSWVLYAAMQDASDTYNGGFWPMKEREPASLVKIGSDYGSQYGGCVFTY